MGNAMALVPRSFSGAVAGDLLTMPDTAKCAAILGVYAQGTAPGYKTVLATNLAPAITECAPTAGGDILFNGTDAITFAEVQYLAYEGSAITDLLLDIGNPVANQGVLLGLRSASVILSCQVLTGTGVGAKAIILRGSTTPSAGNVAISEDGKSIIFAAADAALTATVTYIAAPGEGDAPIAVGVQLDAEDKGY